MAKVEGWLKVHTVMSSLLSSLNFMLTIMLDDKVIFCVYEDKNQTGISRK